MAICGGSRWPRPTRRPVGLTSCCCGMALVLLGWSHAFAADDASPPQPVHLVDAGDLWRYIRHRPIQDPQPAASRRFFVVAPTVTSKPTTGLTAGVSSNIAFHAGDPQTTHLSSLSGGLRVSVKGQKFSGGRL